MFCFHCWMIVVYMENAGRLNALLRHLFLQRTENWCLRDMLTMCRYTLCACTWCARVFGSDGTIHKRLDHTAREKSKKFVQSIYVRFVVVDASYMCLKAADKIDENNKTTILLLYKNHVENTVSFVLCGLCCCVMVWLGACVGVWVSRVNKKDNRRPKWNARHINARWFSVSPVGFRLFVLKSIPAAAALHKSTFTCVCVYVQMCSTRATQSLPCDWLL